jgi:hypothetical protein
MAVHVFYDGNEWDARRAAGGRTVSRSHGGGRYVAAKNGVDAAVVIARLLWVRCGIVEVRRDEVAALDDRIAREALADRIESFAAVQRAGTGIEADLLSAAGLLRGWVPVECGTCSRVNDMPDYCASCSACPTDTL